MPKREPSSAEWKKMVDDGITARPRYLHENHKPVVQIWGFYRNSNGNALSLEAGSRLIDFFQADGRYSAYLMGGGDWDWRKDTGWRKLVLRMNAYSPWNVGNYSTDNAGVKHASTAEWAADKEACEKDGVRWLPVVYPGFSWDNIKHQRPGTTTIPRRGGEFLWEQFHELASLGVDSVYVAMFDEVDEGTAIFKVSNAPPTQGHFVTYDGFPPEWYLRLTGEGAKIIRGEAKNQKSIPIER